MILTIINKSATYFKTIQAAIDSIPAKNESPVYIFIPNGIYHEKISVCENNVFLIGESRDHTIIEYDDYAQKKYPNGLLYQTFNSYTCFVGGAHCVLKNLTIRNTAGSGKMVGQAIALYADGDGLVCSNCKISGYQDTLFTGPLPPEPIIPGSFFGPREHAPRTDTTQLYDSCYIEGDVDFIFGSATALFINCEIHTRGSAETTCYITAPSTPRNKEYGYIFKKCRLTGETDIKNTYLGRPWRNYARAAFLECWMGPHIHTCGWDNWGKIDAEKTSLFVEYCSTGPGAIPNERVSWSHQLTEQKAVQYEQMINHIISNLVKLTLPGWPEHTRPGSFSDPEPPSSR
jgi:pectinesterase